MSNDEKPRSEDQSEAQRDSSEPAAAQEHLPFDPESYEKDEDGRYIMSAQEALKRLKQGQTLKNLRIESLHLQGRFEQKISMRNCHLISLEVAKLITDHPVTLRMCELVRARLHHHSRFGAGLTFSGSTLRYPKISNISVTGDLRFDGCQLKTAMGIKASKVSGLLRFWEAQIEGWLDLSKIECGHMDLRSLSSSEGIAIQRCRIAHDVLLRGATVAKKLDFEGTEIGDTLDLSKAKLHDFVYLENLSVTEGLKFRFENAIADKIRIRRAQLRQRLASENEGDHATAMHEYGLLKENFGHLHRYDDEDWAFYRFKVNERRSATRSWSKPWTMIAGGASWLFLDVGCGYGTDPIRAVRTAIANILFFALIYAAGYSRFQMDLAPIDGLAPDGVVNRLIFGLVKSVSVFTAGLAGDQLTRAQGWVLLPLSLEALIGTALWGLFIVAFSRKVIR